MRRGIARVLASACVALGMSAVQAATAPSGTVIIGQVTCFRIRVPDRGQNIQQRVDHIQDVAPRHLGGETIQFTIRPVGNRRHIDVNGDFLVAVTLEDARATGHKSAATLAPIWRVALEGAFRQSSARPVTPSAE